MADMTPRERLLAVGRPALRWGRRRWGALWRNAQRSILYPKIRSFYRRVDSLAIESAVSACRGKKALLVTVAFNRADLIQWQAELLRQHFGDEFQLVVADNSPVGDNRQRIRDVCERLGVGYVALPHNPANNPSLSHGLALNWVHKNLVERVDVSYIGYLDHDIFPIENVSYEEVIRRQGTYGHFQRAGRFHFYWPGLLFFATDYFRKSTADFRPAWLSGVYADTGAGNWRRYYSRLEPESLACFKLEDVWSHDITEAFDKKSAGHSLQEAAFTLLDRQWIHLVNGSNWAGLDTVSKTAQLRSALASRKVTPSTMTTGDQSVDS